MALIRDVVQEVMKTGCLTIEAEEQLRVLLRTRYNWEDLNAFVRLQEAAMTGQVRQELRSSSENVRDSGKQQQNWVSQSGQ